MQWSLPAMFGSTVELAGAFVIGSVIHQSVVQNAYPIESPVGVFGILGGLALVVVGRRLSKRFEPSNYVPEAEDEDGDEEDAEFDEEFSPVPSERLENREADDSVDRE